MSAPERPGSRKGDRPSRSPEPAVPRDAILEQLDRILSSPLFKNSKRCGPLLKYVVTEAIEGRGEYLKERSIGVAVYARKPTYDTNEDRIVRTAAVEVRKRIAQYYQEPGHASETLIDLTSGSYIPKFRVTAEADHCRSASNRLPDSQLAKPPQVEVVPALSVGTLTRKTLWMSAITLAGVAAAVAAGLWGRSVLASGPINVVWGPLLRADKITLVMGDIEELSPRDLKKASSVEPSFYDTMMADRVGFADGMTIARVAALIGSKGKSFEIRRGGSLNLRELRNAPAVMVGAFNNPWSSTLEESLRYQFFSDESTHTVFLRDQQNPTRPLWKTDWQGPYSGLKEDRAIVSRFVDSRTEQTVLLLAGLGRDGTAAAGEFVTEPRFLRTLIDAAPKNWHGNNLQAVIATDLVNGHSGAPRLVTAYFW